MHIAICDDNIADRKQTERLLGREADARRGSEVVLYIDSFGDSTSLFNAPMLYDLFFLDLHEPDRNGMQFANELRQAGITAPIVLCSSVVDYAALPYATPSLHFLKKPLHQADLCTLIDLAAKERAAAALRVEIRSKHSTHYIDPTTILYAVPKDHLTHICFNDQTTLDMFGTLEELYYLLASTKHFIFAKKHMLLNLECLQTLSPLHMELKNGERFVISPLDYAFIRKFWKK